MFLLRKMGWSSRHFSNLGAIGNTCCIYTLCPVGEPTGFSSNLNYATHQQEPPASDHPSRPHLPHFCRRAGMVWCVCCCDSVEGNVGHPVQARHTATTRNQAADVMTDQLHGKWAKPCVCHCSESLPFLATLPEFPLFWVFHIV